MSLNSHIGSKRRLGDTPAYPLTIALRRKPIETVVGRVFSNSAWEDLKSTVQAYAADEAQFLAVSERPSVRRRLDLIREFVTDLLSAGYYSSGSPEAVRAAELLEDAWRSTGSRRRA